MMKRRQLKSKNEPSTSEEYPDHEGRKQITGKVGAFYRRFSKTDWLRQLRALQEKLGQINTKEDLENLVADLTKTAVEEALMLEDIEELQDELAKQFAAIEQDMLHPDKLVEGIHDDLMYDDDCDMDEDALAATLDDIITQAGLKGASDACEGVSGTDPIDKENMNDFVFGALDMAEEIVEEGNLAELLQDAPIRVTPPEIGEGDGTSVYEDEAEEVGQIPDELADELVEKLLDLD